MEYGTPLGTQLNRAALIIRGLTEAANAVLAHRVGTIGYLPDNDRSRAALSALAQRVAAADAELAADTKSPDKGPFVAGGRYRDEGDDFATFAITVGDHSEKIHVYGDRELRDRIVDVMNADAEMRGVPLHKAARGPDGTVLPASDELIAAVRPGPRASAADSGMVVSASVLVALLAAIESRNMRITALQTVLAKAKAFHDADSGSNGFTAAYETLRKDIDEVLAGALPSVWLIAEEQATMIANAADCIKTHGELADHPLANALLQMLREPPATEPAVQAERKRAARVAKMHAHHALWIGLLDFGWDEKTEAFGRGLAQRISQAIAGGDEPPVEPVAEIAGLVLPDEMTPAIKDALSHMLWHCGSLARSYRAIGEEIPKRAEDEQAHILWKCLRFAVQHGDEWRNVAQAELNARRAANTAHRGQEEKGNG